MNSPLALQLMRFGFLVLLWLFVLAAVRVVRERSAFRRTATGRTATPGAPSRTRDAACAPLRPLAVDRHSSS